MCHKIVHYWNELPLISMMGGRLEAMTKGSFKPKSRSKLSSTVTVLPVVQGILFFHVAQKKPEASVFKFHFSLLYLSISSTRFGTIFWQRSPSKVTLSSCILAYIPGNF